MKVYYLIMLMLCGVGVPTFYDFGSVRACQIYVADPLLKIELLNRFQNVGRI